MKTLWSLLTRPRGGKTSGRPLLPPEDRHLPTQAEIEAYGNGGFRFAEMSHQGAILCLPAGVFAWEVTGPEGMTAGSFARVFAEPATIETLIIGTGMTLVPIDPDVRQALREKGMVVECMTTGSAVRMYNIMLGENRAVAAALLPVE